MVSKKDIITGLSDHEIVYSEVDVRPQVVKQEPCTMHIYKKVDCKGLQSHMYTFPESFMANHSNKTVNQLWEEIAEALQSGIDIFIP